MQDSLLLIVANGTFHVHDQTSDCVWVTPTPHVQGDTHMEGTCCTNTGMMNTSVSTRKDSVLHEYCSLCLQHALTSFG